MSENHRTWIVSSLMSESCISLSCHPYHCLRKDPVWLCASNTQFYLLLLCYIFWDRSDQKLWKFCQLSPNFYWLSITVSICSNLKIMHQNLQNLWIKIMLSTFGVMLKSVEFHWLQSWTIILKKLKDRAINAFSLILEVNVPRLIPSKKILTNKDFYY